MHPRPVCNFIYAHLIANAQSTEDREKFDNDLYEPFAGADGGARRALSMVDQIGG